MPTTVVSEPPASAVAGQPEAIEDRLSSIAPEWKLILKKKPGRKPVDYPEGVLRKGGRTVELNDHAVRLIAATGVAVPPPATVLVRVFVDAKHQLVGVSRADKDDPDAFALTRQTRARGSAPWRVAVGRAMNDAGLQAPSTVRRRIRAFGNRVYGFHFGPEAQS